MTSKLQKHKLMIGLFVTFVLVSLASFAFVGTFSRMAYDDYCIADVSQQHGVLGGVSFYRQEMTGSYTNIAYKMIFSQFHQQLNPWFVTLVILTLFAGFWVLVATIIQVFKLPITRSQSIIITLFMTFISLTAAPSAESYYWFNANIYAVSLVPVLLFASFTIWQVVAGRLGSLSSGVLAAGFSLFIVGTTEVTFITFFVLITALLLGAFFLPANYRQRVFAIVLPSLVASIIGFTFSALAPGNFARQATDFDFHNIETRSVSQIVQGSVILTVLAFVEFNGLITTAFTFLLTTVGLIVLSPQKSPPHSIEALLLKHPRLFIVVTAGLCLSITAGIVLVQVYAVNVVRLRTLFIPRLLHVVTVASWAYILFLMLRKHDRLTEIYEHPAYRQIVVVAYGVLLLFPLAILINNVQGTPGFSAYAQEWDARNALILEEVQAGSTELLLQPIRTDFPDYLSLLRSEQLRWVQDCMARYYGLDSLTIDIETID